MNKEWISLKSKLQTYNKYRQVPKIPEEDVIMIDENSSDEEKDASIIENHEQNIDMEKSSTHDIIQTTTIKIPKNLPQSLEELDDVE